MPHLFPVVTVKKGKPRDWRPSEEESEEGFLLHVKVRMQLNIEVYSSSIYKYTYMHTYCCVPGDRSIYIESRRVALVSVSHTSSLARNKLHELKRNS